jgi:hypothetical protein
VSAGSNDAAAIRATNGSRSRVNRSIARLASAGGAHVPKPKMLSPFAAVTSIVAAGMLRGVGLANEIHRGLERVCTTSPLVP